MGESCEKTNKENHGCERLQAVPARPFHKGKLETSWEERNVK